MTTPPTYFVPLASLRAADAPHVGHKAALLGEAIGSSVGQSFSQALGMPGELVLSPLDGTGFGARWFTLW